MTSLTALDGGRGLAVWGVDVDLAGTTVRVANAPYSSLSAGHFPGKVQSIGSINYVLSDRAGSLGPTQFSIMVNDTDRTIARIISGAAARSVRGSEVSVYLMTPTVASSSWTRVFFGEVARVSYPSPFMADITVRTRDRQLRRESRQPVVTKISFPSAHAGVIGSVVPVSYGYRDARPRQTGGGLLPTLYVDTSDWRYLVCAGKAKAITRVYKDDVDIGTGNWATEYLTRDGRIYTVINFTEDQGDSVITCDAEGYETVGDGSGSVITNPASQLAHFLTNFVLSDYKTGNWASTNALIDSTLLTAEVAYHTSLTSDGAFYLDERLTGLDILAKYCVSYQRRCWWTLDGTLGLGGENPFVQPYTGQRWRWYRDEVGPLSISERDVQVVSKITVNDYWSPAQGKGLNTFDVVDASIDPETGTTLDLEWSGAR